MLTDEAVPALAHLLSMLLHVVEGVIVRVHQLEGLVVEGEPRSNEQVPSTEVLRHLTLKKLLARFLNATAFQELTAQHTWQGGDRGWGGGEER